MSVLPRGGTAWLVAHEMRLIWRDNSKAGRAVRIGALLFLLLVPVVGGIGLAFSVRDAADVPADAIGYAAAGWWGLVVLMLSGASLHVLRVFHDRADLDLLLAAPLPPARVLAAKSVAVQLTVALPMLVITTPFLIVSALLGHPNWLGGTVMVAIAAVIATAGAFVAAGALFRQFGARRARMIVQIAGGIFGVAVGLGGQAANFAPQTFARVTHWLRETPTPPFDAPALAVFGAPLPLLAFVALAGGAASLSARLAADQLQAGRHEAATARGHGPARFGGSPERVLLLKELRLLGRDPELLATILLQLAYMIPAFGVIFLGGNISPGRLAAAVVLLAGLLAASLGWLTICGEDAPDLVAAAPVPPATVRRVKLAAACLPPLAVAGLPLLVLVAIDPRAAGVGLVLAPAAALAGAVLQGWAAKPMPRKAFRARQRGSILLALSEYVLAGAWAGAAALLYTGSPWTLAPLAVAGLVLAIAFVTRVR